MSEPANNGIFPKFYIKAMKNEAKSTAAGHPVFDEIEMVEIRIAGDPKNVVTRKVRENDIERWHKQYAQFKRKEEQVSSGYPVTEWPALSRGEAATLKALNIHTVEALAELPDSGLQNIGMGARELQKKAVAFLEAAKDSGAVERQRQEIEKQNETIAQQAKMLEDLKAEIEALKAQKTTRKKKESKEAA